MTHPSSLAIDTLAANRMSAPEASAVRAHIDTCERCRADFAEANAAVSTFTREVFPRTRDRLTVPARPWWRSLLPVLAPVLAAAMVLVWFVRRPESVPTHEDVIRTKGGLTFRVFARRDHTVHLVQDGEALAAGDQIRFVAGGTSKRYILVVSIDGRGTASVYYPYGGSGSALLGDGTSELPGSIVLDTAPGAERLFAVFTPEPIAAGPVLEQLRAIASKNAIRDTRSLDVPASAQATLVFDKATP
ncbi:MAG TPA: zf-HC2 domain-containing protein [Kofleriaceae bacterium]|jgi:hypothetical protein